MPRNKNDEVQGGKGCLVLALAACAGFVVDFWQKVLD